MLKILFVIVLFSQICLAQAQTVTGGAITGIRFEKKRIMCIGDSITLGSNGGGANTNVFGFRDNMQDILGITAYQFVGQLNNNTATADLVYQVPHEGVAGNKFSQILARTQVAIETDMPKPNPSGSMVIIQGGINDIGNSVLLATSLSDLSDIITTINTYDPSIDIFVQTVLPSTNATVNSKVNLMNTGFSTTIASLKSSLSRSNIYLIDVNAYITANCPPFSSSSTCSTDGTHPTDAGYLLMAEQITACINNRSATNCS